MPHFLFLVICCAVRNTTVQVPLLHAAFDSLGVCTGMVELHAKVSCHSPSWAGRRLYTDSHTGCTNLPSHQLCIMAPPSPSPSPHILINIPCFLVLVMPYWSEMESQYGFDVCFLDAFDVDEFSCIYWSSTCGSPVSTSQMLGSLACIPILS